MLLYTSVKEPGVKLATSMKRLNSGSFNEEHHGYDRTSREAPHGFNQQKVSFIRSYPDEDGEGEIKEDSEDEEQNHYARERTEQATIPLSKQSKSKERIPTATKRQSAQTSNALIYQSSPTKFSTTIETP